MVHGVGRHAPLSSLLEVYQSFRSNTRSPEAPLIYEDRIQDWRLDEVNEGTAPPYLKLIPRFPDARADIVAVYIYEVNYSALAGVVRQNHPLDLTTLFVGLDLAVAAARQALKDPRPSMPAGDAARLGRILQRGSGVLAAATVPILGVPSILLREYTESFVSTFSRFFEDVATFALDKNGEQLIAAHLDRTIENIVESPNFVSAANAGPSEFIVAAHSLGTVVVHNHLIRMWTDATKSGCVPDKLLTFGSPIGLLTWLWLFLDFPDLTFNPKRPVGSNYFCWSPTDNAGTPAKSVEWTNVVNRCDPIATAFPLEAVDLSMSAAAIEAGLTNGRVKHHYLGKDGLFAVTGAHTDYLHDRSGFLDILLRIADLRHQSADAVTSVPVEQHWASTRSTLTMLWAVLWVGAIVCAAAYCAVVSYRFHDWRVLGAVVLFAYPRLTIWLLTFWQRLFFGGPTKRIYDERIASLRWFDVTSFPFRLRRAIRNRFVRDPEIDPDAPARPIVSLFLKAFSFTPTIGAMLLPVLLGVALSGHVSVPRAGFSWYLGGLILFTGYLLVCAMCELVATWRSALEALGLGDATAR